MGMNREGRRLNYLSQYRILFFSFRSIQAFVPRSRYSETLFFSEQRAHRTRSATQPASAALLGLLLPGTLPSNVVEYSPRLSNHSMCHLLRPPMPRRLTAWPASLSPLWSGYSPFTADACCPLPFTSAYSGTQISCRVRREAGQSLHLIGPRQRGPQSGPSIAVRHCCEGGLLAGRGRCVS